MARRHGPVLSRAPRSVDEFYDLTLRPQLLELWLGVTAAVSQMRDKGASLRRVAQAAGISPAVVRRLAGSALKKLPNGRYVARATDRLLRVLEVPSPDGRVEVAVRDSKVASEVAAYWNAVHRYLTSGDVTGLEGFQGVIIRGIEFDVALVTDPETLDRLGRAGDLSFESIYSRGGL